MIALIDADIVVHRVGFTTENEGWGIAKYRCDDMIESILAETEADAYMAFLSDSTENGFRKKINPDYKANRTAPKPHHYDRLKEHLITEWDATITLGEEADDRLGITQMGNTTTDTDGLHVCASAICSIDKDLLQIPGHHYNFVKKEWNWVSFEQGLKFFYMQLLIGDVSDNIQGVQGIGPKTAEKLLGSYSSEADYYKVVVEAYEKRKEKDLRRSLTQVDKDNISTLILATGQLLKIRTKEEEVWSFPTTYTKAQPLADTPL